MSLDLTEIALVAQAILDRLGNKSTRWTVVETTRSRAPDIDPSIRSLVAPDTVLVRAAKTSEPSSMIRSYFVLGIPTQQAIMQLASSLQDEAIGEVHAGVPVCPQHQHPLTPRLDHDRAVWACPLNGDPIFAITNTE